MQDDHLDSMARHLDELGSLATNLNASLAHHADTLENLDEKMESNLVKSNAVTRRTDRLIQKKVRLPGYFAFPPCL
jgi:broad-specificity NMP kinase